MSIPSGLMVDPGEDAGAQTLNRYHWQAWIAVSHCLAVAAEVWDAAVASASQSVLIVCEHLEDYVVCRGDDFILVNVKHRDLSVGAWTWARLFDDGGMRHLFRRWLPFDGSGRPCFATNAALSTGDPSTLALICEVLREEGELTDEQDALIEAFGERLWSGMSEGERRADWGVVEAPPAYRDAIRSFLAALIFICECPNRNEMQFAAPSKYMQPFLELLGKDPALASAAWQAIVGLAVERMQGRGEQSLGSLQELVGLYAGQPIEARRAAALEARVLSLEDIVEAIEIVEHSNLRAVRYVTSIPRTRLAAKLINGGCSVPTVHAAEAAAQRWRELESAANADVPAKERLAAVQMAVGLSASRLFEELKQDAEGDFGSQFWIQLGDRLGHDVAEVSVDDAIGAACDLASQCRLWFGDVFDVEAAIQVLPGRLASAAA